MEDLGVGPTASMTLGRGAIVCQGRADTYKLFCRTDSAHQVMMGVRRGPPSTRSQFGTGIRSVCASRVSVQTRTLTKPTSSSSSPAVGTQFPLCSKRGQVPSRASLCQHRSLPPSSSEEAVRIWREVFIPLLRDRFSHNCCEEIKAQDVNDAGAQHSFLSVTFVDQGAV